MYFPVFISLCVFLAGEASTIVEPNRRQADNFVTFSAGLDHQLPLALNETVIYNIVWTNKGNGYDSNTGVFTCPQAGLYSFMFHGVSETTGSMILDLYKNSEYEISARAHQNADYASAGNSVTLSLANGDQVYIRGHGTSVLYGASDEIYSTFSGFLIQPSSE